MNDRVLCLLIEDNAGDVALTNWSFEGTRFDFLVASNGEDGLEMARTHHPDLVFLDINMPRMNGDEVLRELKLDESTRTIPVVMLTHSTNPEDIRTAYALHCAAYVQKPVTVHKFKELASAMNFWWADSVMFDKDVPPV